jgi:hypothetical protein
MPSKSSKQASLMRAVAHSPSFAAKVGIPVSVGKEFESADKRAGRFQAHHKHVGKQHRRRHV